MKTKKNKTSFLQMTPLKRRVILHVLIKIEKTPSPTTYQIDLFDTGIIINSEKVKKKIINFIREII